MKLKTALMATALTSGAFAAQAQEVTVMSWGGAYTKSQVEAGNVSIDVADVEFSDAVRLCDEGLLEIIDHSMLPDAPDGTPASEDFIEGGLQDCAVASIVWSTVVAYNSENVEGSPDSIDAFFNTEEFPGKRGLRKTAKATLEMALMADGVPAAEVYDILETDEGIDRAFAKLDTIKDDIVWWEAGAQPPQLLADGEVVMSTAYNGRIFNAAVGEGQPLEIVWDGQILDFDLFVVPRGAPNKDAAMQFITFSTDTQRLADQASWISYGPARKSSGEMVGKFMDGETEMAPHMPTAEKNLENALVNNFEFWVDMDAELNERFNAWLAQ
jgi:putative spermidine/putrescine transport system substrate-binding protein